MIQPIPNTSKVNSSDIFTYKNKGHFTRFIIVNIFFIRKLIILLFHYRVLKPILNLERIKKREEELYSELGQDLKILILKLGGVYIKVGQFLSNLTHALPSVFIERLQDLQDRIPPHSFEEIKERFLIESNKDIETIFPGIEKKPLAAASTAQVHLATIGANRIVIKILYPGIEELILKDLETLLFVMKRLSRYLINFNYKSIHSEIKDLILREMDLRNEATAIKKMTHLFKKEKDIIFPLVYDTYSSKGVLVTEFIEGVKFSKVAQVQRKSEKKSRAVELLVRAYILMIFKFRYYHADPHSGNLIYTPDDKLCFIDFGAVEEINDSSVVLLKKIILNAMSNDYYGVLETMEELGFFTKDIDRTKIEKIIKFGITNLKTFLNNTEYFRNLTLEQIGHDDAMVFLQGINSSLSDLLKISQIPNNFLILHRVFGLLIGNVATVDPYRSVFDYAEKPFNMIVVGGSRLQRIAKEEAGELTADALTIPRDLKNVLLSMYRGRIYFKSQEIENHSKLVYSLTRQVIYTLIMISSIFFGNFFFDKNIFYVYYTFYSIAGFFGLLLLFSMLNNDLD